MKKIRNAKVTPEGCLRRNWNELSRIIKHAVLDTYMGDILNC